MLASLFATLAGKIAAGGLAVAMATTGALAGTGNLPAPAQTAVSEALGNIGVNIPSGDDALENVEASVDADLDVDVDGDTAEPNDNSAFGQEVAADAKDGGVNGQEISEKARAMAEQRKAAGQANRPSHAGTDSDGADASGEAGPPADAGSESQTGLDTARNTPAGDKVPSSVPVGGRR